MDQFVHFCCSGGAAQVPLCVPVQERLRVHLWAWAWWPAGPWQREQRSGQLVGCVH